MKGFGVFLKILAVLAAIGGAIYVGITYGDKIVAWVKKILKIEPGEEVCCCEGDCCDGDCSDESCCCEQAPAQAPAAQDTVEAEETDFEG